MTVLPPKPRYREACNGCGICCALELCQAADVAFPGASAPCPALKIANGRTYCELVVQEAKAVEQGLVKVPFIAMGLGIGLGCSMRDDPIAFEDGDPIPSTPQPIIFQKMPAV